MPRRTRLLNLALCLAAVLIAPAAAAAPMKTWGVDPPVPDETEPTTPTEPPPVRPPVTPPPTESEAPRPPERTMAPGGLRYVLEGVEVRGNTTTLARVILRFVPFQRGMTLDVDDKELVLTRFRLLGTGFF